MKLVWCPKTASKAYIDTVKSLTDCGDRDPPEDSNVAELLSAMAGGWKARCILEAWESGGGVATSLGLVTASRLTGGRHICVVPDERLKSEYAEAMRAAGAGEVEVVVGEAEEVVEGISAVDFLVVDCRRKDFVQFLRSAQLGPKGAVLVCKGSGGGPRSADGASWFRWRGELTEEMHAVRSTFLPIGRGLEIVHVRVGRGPSLGSNSRWIKHVDRDTMEEHVFRR